MFGPNDISAELPTPRDDEPASLRQDIVDELRDHLECAFVRELHSPVSRGCKSADQTTRDAPWQRVLSRFGNPATIARRLWWDSMQERIMAQRFTAIMAGIAAAACVAGCVLLWQMVQQGRAAQEAMLAGQHELIEKLLNQIAAAKPGNTIDPRLAGWAEVSIRLVSASDPTRPVQGHAKISGGPIGIDFDTQNQISKEAEADESGRIDFGTVPLGKYWLTINSDSANASCAEEVIIGPEGFENISFPCPVDRPESAQFSFAFPDLPESLQGVAFLIAFGCSSETIAGRTWQRGDGYHRLLVQSDGQIVGEQQGREREYSIMYGTQPFSSRFPGFNYDQRTSADGSGQLYQIERNPDVRAHAYGVSEILVLSPRDAEQLKDGQQIDTVRLAQLDLTWKADFRPVAGQPNTWVIHLPAELLRRAEASRFAYGLRPVPEGMTLARIIPDTGGSLPPGTRVDVSVTYLLPDTGEPDAQTRTLLTNVELFAPAVRDGRSALIETDLALLVTPEQAAAVDAARSHAWFRLSESAEQSTAVTGELPDPGLMEELNRAQPPERRSRFRGTGPAFQ